VPSLAPPPSQEPATQVPEEKVAESITYGLRNASWDLSPWKGVGSAGNTMWLQLYSSLLASASYGTPVDEMQYDIAESVTFSADRLTATVKLRDYVHDSKGNPIKAEDVVFSYQTAPRMSGVYARINTYIETISALDELTVVIKIAKVVPGVWESLLPYCPIVSKSWYESASDDEKSNNPASTGAYRVAENIAGSSVTFTALDDFWQKDELRSMYQIVNVRNIIYVAIVENAMRVIALENGEIDIALIENVNYPAFASNPDFNTFEYAFNNPTTILLNCADGRVFSNNAALRKAVLHAIDFDQVRIASSGDFGWCGHDVAPMICSNYDPAWNNEPYFDYDLDIAMGYLAEAGYTANSGITLHFLCRNIPTQIAAITVIQSCLMDIGIDLLIDAYDQALYDTYIADPSQWDLTWYTANNATGLVTESWEFYFGSRGELGSAGFVKDEKLQQLLSTAQEKNDPASLNAFRSYVLEQGYGANTDNPVGYIISKKDVTSVKFSFLINAMVNTCTFTDEYVPAAG